LSYEFTRRHRVPREIPIKSLILKTLVHDPLLKDKKLQIYGGLVIKKSHKKWDLNRWLTKSTESMTIDMFMNSLLNDFIPRIKPLISQIEHRQPELMKFIL
jgi:hypothetical protein